MQQYVDTGPPRPKGLSLIIGARDVSDVLHPGNTAASHACHTKMARKVVLSKCLGGRKVIHKRKCRKPDNVVSLFRLMPCHTGRKGALPKMAVCSRLCLLLPGQECVFPRLQFTMETVMLARLLHSRPDRDQHGPYTFPGSL